MNQTRLLWLSSFLLTLITGTFAAAHARGSDVTAAGVRLRRANQAGYYAITGVNTGRNAQTGARPARRNILDLQNDIASWSLYVQAMTAMQNADNSNPLSYFQIAGIHGRPYVPWNNFNQVLGAGPGTSAFGGYCTHNSILFPTWHRPYLTLVEQVIGQYAQAIAKNYTGALSSVYQNAANNLRLPYWDWATNPDMPPVVSQPIVQITTPSGVQWVNNPLYTYKFHQFPMNTTLFPGGGLANSPQTYRATNANQVLEGSNLMSRAWYALVKSTSYNAFATSATSGTSIENVHNDIHNAVGGGGHMTYLDWSAFDPIFWLHHVNVDRMFALWQAAFPTTYMTTPLADPGTFVIIPQSVDSANTNLGPFTSNSAGQQFTSNSVRYLSSFDYSYPEIQDWTQSTEQLRKNVTAQIYNMYDPNGIFGSQTKTRSLNRRKALTPGSETKEWSIGLAVNKYDLNGDGFWLRFFVGDIPQNPSDWITTPDCVASIQVIPPPQVGNGPLPVIVEYDELNLDQEVAKAGYSPEDVTSIGTYFGKNLQWRIQKLDGTVVPTENVPSLNITVSDEVVSFPTDKTQLPTYGEKTLHSECTKGKSGGYA